MQQQNLFETVAIVQSFSNPEKEYTVKKNLATGQISCDCPAWIFQKGPVAERKPCKHIRSLTA